VELSSRPQRPPARPRLLRAAVGCLALKGHADTSVGDICLAAGCSKGAFYFHFPSKESVLLALVEERLVMSATGNARCEAGNTCRVLLDTWIRAVRYRPLRRLLVRRFRERSAGIRGGERNPGTTLGSALRTGLVVQRVVHPGIMEGVSESTMVRLGVEAPAA
jgi:AcrR family transcriptional regulator